MSEVTEQPQDDLGGNPDFVPPATNEADQLSQVAALLRGEKPGEPTKQPDKPPEKKELKTIADAAERLGIPIEKLYELEFGVGNDQQKYSLGKLKDHFTARNDFEIERLRWGETKAQQEADNVRARNEVLELVSLLPKDAIKPEVMTKLRERHTAHITRENARTLEVIPDWKDEKVREADMAGMREHLTSAGFPAKYLDNIIDHLSMRYIRANYLREKRINEALALVKPKQPETPAQRPSGNRGNARAERRQSVIRGSGESQQVKAVSELLNSKQR